MHQLLIILKVVLVVLLILTILLWLMAQGGGHNIPQKTNIKFGIAAAVFLGLLVTIIYRDNIKKAD